MKKKHAEKCLWLDPKITQVKENEPYVCNCDGYHTFDELYEHRATLYIALCLAIANQRYVWRSKLHSDGSAYDGWFILGIGIEKGNQATYHLPDSKWSDTHFAITLAKAPEWDGHAPDDVLDVIRSLFL